MLNTEKRAFMPSFFIILAFCFSLVASILTGEAYRWGALACLLVLFFKPLPKPYLWNQGTKSYLNGGRNDRDVDTDKILYEYKGNFNCVP